MNFIFVGLPGAGKGTFAKIFSKELNIFHFSVGDAIREEIRKNTEAGLKVKSFVAKGQLVPDEFICDFAIDRLRSNLKDGYSGFILDGFPRTIRQAQELTKQSDLKIKRVIDISLDEDIAIEKLLSRRRCSTCGRDGFNVADIHRQGYNMPALLPDPKTCPLGPEGCKPVYEMRSDDTREIIEERFRSYRADTEPVLAYYRGMNLLSKVEIKKGVSDAPLVKSIMLSE